MSLIINIDSATEHAHVSISKNGIVLQEDINVNQKDHAAFLQVAIKNILHKSGIRFNEVNAIAVTIGPGSYTGLRVGLASAKGLCYALKIPLITLSTLNVLAQSALNTTEVNIENTLLCPMIDARRMEVFTAIFDKNLETILPECAMVLNNDSFNDLLNLNKIAFFGNGSTKWQQIYINPNAFFVSVNITSLAMSQLAINKYNLKEFSNLAYTEPQYLKEFYFN